MTYYQDNDVQHLDQAQDGDPHVGRRQLGDSPHPLRSKTTENGKMKATLPDIKIQDDNNRKLTRKDLTPCTPCGPLTRTTWVITEKTDNLSKTESKVKARLCTMGNSSKEFSKDSVQFESPSCGRDTVKAILSLVPDNKWRIGTFDVSLAFFQGESLQREVYVKNPEIVLFLENILTTR